MRIISCGDSYADALSTTAIATIPFIAIGVLDRPTIWYTAVILGSLFACAFFIRFAIVLKKDCARKSKRLDDLVSTMQVPYVFALAACFFMEARYPMAPVFWVTLGAAIIAAAYVLFFHDDDF